MGNRITVFTPVYNRAKELERLYLSLKRQTCFDFEWIVIDDGSSDDADALVTKWMNEGNPFEISFKKQEHGGKHRAMNKAFFMAASPWFFPVDSDDYLYDDAIEKICGWTEQVKDDGSIAAVAGSRHNIATDVVMSCPVFLRKNPGFVCLNSEREKFGLECDKAEVYRTDVLRAHLFPEFDGEYFCTEAVCWDSIAKDGYYIKFYPDGIYFCEYLPDGLTNSGANSYDGFLKNFYGFLSYLKIEYEVLGLCPQVFSLFLIARRLCKEKRIHESEVRQFLSVSESEYLSVMKTAGRQKWARRFSKYIFKADI